MPNSDKWSISNDASSPTVGNDLTGLKIKKTGSGYELYKVVAKTTETAPPFSFENFTYDDQTWDLNVTSLAPGQNGGGTWQTPASGSLTGDPTDGDFTAQAGGGADEDEDEAASSASA